MSCIRNKQSNVTNCVTPASYADGAGFPQPHPRRTPVHHCRQVGGRPSWTLAADRPRDDAE